MNRTLKEFTKEDWDILFPIELVEHNSEWSSIFESEKKKINEITDSKFLNRIEHFGSSSIPNIKSKPYIDILIEVPRNFLFNEKLIKQLESIGYTCLTQPDSENENNYMILVKGYHPNGTCDQVFHMHACPKDHPMMIQLEFRDFLFANPERAKEYEKLKTQLEQEYKNDRSGYRIAKTDFITETLELAKE